MPCQLEILRFHTWVRLGCSADERSIRQEVEIDLKINFDTKPKGCQSDELSDTLCYAQLCERIDAVCRAQDYALVERVAERLEQMLRTEWFEKLNAAHGRVTGFELSVHKIRPPIENLRGGVKFRIKE